MIELCGPAGSERQLDPNFESPIKELKTEKESSKLFVMITPAVKIHLMGRDIIMRIRICTLHFKLDF